MIHKEALEAVEKLQSKFVGNSKNPLSFVIYPIKLQEGSKKSGEKYRFYNCNIVENISDMNKALRAKNCAFSTDRTLELKKPIEISGYAIGNPSVYNGVEFYRWNFVEIK